MLRNQTGSNQLVHLVFCLVALCAVNSVALPVKGFVVDSLNQRIANARVSLHDPKSGTEQYSSLSDADGYYFFTDILEMDYQIQVTASGFPDQWCAYGHSTLYRQYVTRFGIAATPDTLFISIVPNPVNNTADNSLTVNLVDSVGKPLQSYSGIVVSLLRKFDNVYLMETPLTSSASVTFTSLQPSEYAISIGGNLSFQQFYHPTRNTRYPAAFIAVSGGTTFTQTVRLADPPVDDAYLHGICRSETDAPLGGVTVSLCLERDTMRVMYTQITSSAGTFTFDSILDAEYFIRVSEPSYPPQWFSHSQTTSTLYPQDLVWPMHYASDTILIRMTKTPLSNPSAAKVSVLVMDSTNTPINPSGSVFLINKMDNSQLSLGYNTTTQHYTIENIPAGDYFLKFNVPPYPPQFYTPSGNSTVPYSPITVDKFSSILIETNLVTKPATTTTTGFSGTITGTIYDTSSSAASETFITIFNANKNVIKSITTDTNGNIPPFSIPSQNIYIELNNPSFPTQYWSHQGITFGMLPENLVYLNPNDTLFISALLQNRQTHTAANAIVQGTVKDATTNSPVKNARVVLFDNDPGQNFNTRHIWSPWVTYTDSLGLYTITDIPPGTYRCMAEAESLNYIVQFYPDYQLPSNAKLLSIDTTYSTFTLDFTFKKGAILKGSVTDLSGNPIAGTHIHSNNQENSRWFETVSDTNGNWQIAGLPASSWNVWANHDQFIVVNDTIRREYRVSAGSTVNVPAYQMKRGSHLSGTFSSLFSLLDSTSGSTMHEGDLLLFDKNESINNHFVGPRHHSGIVFNPTSTDGRKGTFATYVTPPGTFSICYVPRAEHSNTISATTALIPGPGYTFLGSSTSSQTPYFTIPSGDTLKGLSLALRKGFSIFGAVKTETGSVLTSNFGIDVFIKIDSSYFNIAWARQLPDGRFEIPGIVDNEDYYLQIWAEGYPHQFWSSNGNTASPSEPFHFNAATYSALSLSVVRNPQGIDPNSMSGPLSLWIEGDSSGYPLLSWSCEKKIAIEKFVVYRKNRDSAPVEIARVPASSSATTYRYRDTDNNQHFREYIITGIGSNVIVKSQRNGFDPRYSTQANTMWLEVFSNRYGIQLEWGIGVHQEPSERDSVSVYRSIGSEPERLLFRRSAHETMIHDYMWDHADSGKTYTYHIEWPEKNFRSPDASITLSPDFFKQLPATHVVGPYEKYQRISDAIAAASDFDHIEVRAGTYKENLSFKGKLLSINGSWEYGKPPVIDGGGAVALTIPYSNQSTDWQRIRISGIAFKNSSVAIKSFAPVEIEGCLFDNVNLAVSMAIDSAAMTKNLVTNPFLPLINDAWVRQCTFIAKKAGSLIASVNAAGKAEQPGYTGEYSGFEQFYLSPIVSLSTTVAIELSSIAFYRTKGLQTNFPVTLQGNTSRVKCSRSNSFLTANSSQSGNLFLDDAISTSDPQFVDSIWWFNGPASPLAGSNHENFIGYEARSLDNNHGQQTGDQPAAVTTVSARTVGLNRVLITWSASPLDDNISRYLLYRIPGDPALFYINQHSQWDLKVPEDSLFKVIDSFSTTRTAFLDTTVITGKPYLYVVAAVNASGRESEINLPAPPAISSYFVNTLPMATTLLANQWQLLGTTGAADVAFPSDTRHMIYSWDDKRTTDKLYANYYKSTTLQSRTGYWFKPETATTITATAASLDSLKAIESTAAIQLAKGVSGWNMVSSPFPFALAPAWLSSYPVWEWRADSAGYRKASSLVPWKAYWIHTEKDTVLTLWKQQPLAAYLTTPLAKNAVSPLLWQLTLSLQSGNSFDTDNQIGAVRPGLQKKASLSYPKPPAAFDGARLYIIDTQSFTSRNQQPVFELSSLNKILTDQTTLLEWTIGVGASKDPSTLSVHNITRLPSDWHLFWVENNQITEIDKKNSSITFPPFAEDHYGLLVATSDPAALHRYSLKLSLGTPVAHTRNGPVTIPYTIPYQWSGTTPRAEGNSYPVSLTLYDMAGRIIASLVNERKVPGVYRAQWSGKNSSGNSVATGVYFIRLHTLGQYKTARLFRVR